MRPASLFGLMLVLAACGPANAQGLTASPGPAGRPIVGSTGGLTLPRQAPPPGSPISASGPSKNTALISKVHLDPTGKPCVAVTAYSRPRIASQTLLDKEKSAEVPQPAKPNIFEHMITAQNRCSRLIKLKLCYYGSQSCVAAEVPGYGRKETVLGVYPSLREFRYEYVELF